MTTSIIFVDAYSYEAMYIFNANAFVDILKSEVTACTTRLTVFRRNVREVRRLVSEDFDILEKRILNDEELRNLAIAKPENSLVCYQDNTHYVSAIFGTLIFLKSFLDIYSMLISKSIIPGQRVSFNEGKIDGVKIKGGRLINWLRESAPAEHRPLSDIIQQHSQDWIGLAVEYRDKLVHTGDLPELQRMCVPLQPRNPPFVREDMQPPKMPHDENVTDYVFSLAANVHKFLGETIPLLPNVDLGMIDFREFPLVENA